LRSSADRGPADARLAAALLAALYLALALHGLGAADVIGDDEAREAGIVQDIVRGHWLLPRFNQDLIPDKPILYHWLAATACLPAGFSPFAARLPAALAGAGIVWWTARLGAVTFGVPAGLAAGMMLATTPALFTHARVARPDTLLVLLLAMAFGLTFRWWRYGRQRDAAWALAVLGASVFAKGPVGPVLFGVTLVGFLALQRDLRRLTGLLTWPGVLAFLVLGFGWYATALAGWGDEFVRQHLVGRYLRNLAGGLAQGGSYSPKPLRYHLAFYVVHLPAIALPWTPVIAVALWRLVRTGGLRDPRARFLLCWAAAPLIVFTPAEYKLRYYLLPSLPALALLAGPTLAALPWRPGARRPDLARGAAALALAAGAVAAAWVVLERPAWLSASDRRTIEALLAAFPGGWAGLTATLGFVVGIAMVAIALAAWRMLAMSVAAATIVVMATGIPALERATSDADSFTPFAAVVAARVPGTAPLFFYGDVVRPVIVALDRDVPSIRRGDAIPAGASVIVGESDYRVLVARAALGPPLAVGEGRTGNLARGRLVLAEALGERGPS
jgi:4-amino-4-deoxy-L-arabinose transferase-like glycosyltransferase